MKKKPWFTLNNAAGQKPELLIYDVIDDWGGVSARHLVQELKAITEPSIVVRINSPGGSVFDGVAIYNALRFHPAHIEVRIEGLAASIASVIAMAGDEIYMASNALMMIHNTYGWASGDATDMRKMAEMMEKTTEIIAQTYMSKSVLNLEDILHLMNEETWFTAQEALSNGFVTHIDEPIKMVAKFDLSAFCRVPTMLESAIDEFTIAETEPLTSVTADDVIAKTVLIPEQTSESSALPLEEDVGIQPKELLAIVGVCRQFGYADLAESFIKKNLTTTEVEARLKDYDEIKNLCAAARCPELSAAFIAADKSVETVRRELFDQLVAATPKVDNTFTPEQQTIERHIPINTTAIYQRRNHQS